MHDSTPTTCLNFNANFELNLIIDEKSQVLSIKGQLGESYRNDLSHTLFKR